MTILKSTFTLAILIFICSCGANDAPKSPVIADGAELQLVSDQFKFTEGPASDREGNVYFTDQPNNTIMKWSTDGSLSVYMDSAGRANGLYFDHEGNLLACADLNNELWRIDANKNATVVLSGFQGSKYNGPNDLWLDKQGGIYFTDPLYKRPYWEDTTERQPNNNLFYLPPGGSVPLVLDSTMVRPNGIIGTPENDKLYVADNSAKKTYVYRIEGEGVLAGKSLFADMGSDGMTIDSQGNVYLTGEGVTVFNKVGERIEEIPINRSWTANVTFGGPDQDMLFITAMNSLYTLKMKVKGVRY